MYKIRNQYKYVIDFFSPNINLISFNVLFGSSSVNNLNPKLSYILGPTYVLNNKKTKAKARKDVREQKKAEVKEEKRVIIEVAKKKKRIVVEAAKEKKKVAIEVAKKKKKVEAKAAKKKKRVKIKVAKDKKWDNKAIKNMQIILKKTQINKHKAVLLASNPLPKKNYQNQEIIKLLLSS